MPHRKTPHFYAVELTHSRIEYGEILESKPELLVPLKKAIFEASRELFLDAAAEGIEVDMNDFIRE